MSTLKSNPLLPLLVSLGLAVPTLAQAQEDPRALMFLARTKQLRAGGEDPSGAVVLYRKVVALEPRSSEAHLRLSEALIESGDVEGALAPAIKATELNPRNADAWVHLGLLQAQRAQTVPAARVEVRNAFQEASRLLPGDPEVWYRLAQSSQALGDAEGAMKAWLALGRLHPSGWLSDRPLVEVAWENAAGLAKALGRYEATREAVMALGDLPQPNEKHLRMVEELAREQADKGFLGHAEETFLLLGSHFPTEPAIWENIAHIQMQTGRFEEALKSLREAEALKRSARFSYFQGICLLHLGRLPEAEILWRKLISGKELPESTPELEHNARHFLSATVLMLGRPGEVLKLLQGWPGSSGRPELLALKTQALVQTKAWKAAGASLADGMNRFPDASLFKAARSMPPRLLKEGMILKKDARQAMMQLDYEAMADLWAEFHQWSKCLDMVRLARTSASFKRLDLLMLESTALDQLNRPEEAIRVLREAQKLNPSYPMLQNNLGYLILENGGDLQEASGLIQSAMAQDPANGSTVDSWGWVLYRQGRFKESEEALRKAVDLTPYSPEIRKHLGEVLLKLGRPEEALEQWERALAYAFPQRKELEEKVEKLRTELAKKGSAKPSSDDPEAEGGTDEPSDDEDFQ